MRIENECTNSVLLNVLLFNTRLKLYKQYIRYAQEKGYTVLPLEEYHSLPDRESGRHLILRHDVDHPGRDTRMMFEAEKELGVRSTYYFRMSTIDKQLIEEMAEAGFEVGFHFETIANYIIETGETRAEQIDMGLMRERFRTELAEFEKRTGHKVKSVCSHGAPENVKLGITNNAIFDGTDLHELGIELEAYDADMYKKCIDCHIMDGTVLIHYGFSYADTPYTAVNDGYCNIVFLSHPNHWFMGFFSRMKKLAAFVIGKNKKTTTRVFKGAALRGEIQDK